MSVSDVSTLTHAASTYAGNQCRAAAAIAAAQAAHRGAESTKGMAAAAGRSSYVPQTVLADNADPGAVAVAIWIEAVATVLVAADA